LEKIAEQFESSPSAIPAAVAASPPPTPKPEVTLPHAQRATAEEQSANREAPASSPAPSPVVKPEGAVRWDIGWLALAVGALAVCSIYWFVVDPAFVESLMASPTPGTGRITGGILLLSVGTAVGVPLWCCVWFLNYAANGRARSSFKPFTLAGMVTLLALGWAGQAEKARSEQYRLDWERTEKQQLKQQFLSSVQLSPVGSKGTTSGRNRSLLVIQYPPPGVSI
jgi:hypothetical protein